MPREPYTVALILADPSVRAVVLAGLADMAGVKLAELTPGEALAAKPPDLALIDEDCWPQQLTDRLAAHVEGGAGGQVLMLTSKRSPAILTNPPGPWQLTKPFTAREVGTLVARWLESTARPDR